MSRSAGDLPLLTECRTLGARAPAFAEAFTLANATAPESTPHITTAMTAAERAFTEIRFMPSPFSKLRKQRSPQIRLMLEPGTISVFREKKLRRNVSPKRPAFQEKNPGSPLKKLLRLLRRARGLPPTTGVERAAWPVRRPGGWPIGPRRVAGARGHSEHGVRPPPGVRPPGTKETGAACAAPVRSEAGCLTAGTGC